MNASLSNHDQRVLVTAAGQGIGRAVASAFARNGARVHICDIAPSRLAGALATMPAASGTVADVSIPEQVQLLFDDVDRQLGGLDILINNAGISGPVAPVEEISPAEWDRTMDVNISGQFYCTRLAVPRLRQAGGGSIVNIASTAGLFGYPMRAPYAASKWAVIGFTKTLAMELGQYSIRVNAICPGAVDGPRMDRVIAAEAAARDRPPEEVREGYLRQVSMHTFIDRDDIANLILFLCSAAGARISGQALSVDGHTETLRT